MNFELNGMEELNEQELMMVDGGKLWHSSDWKKALGIVAAVAVVAVVATTVAVGSMGVAVKVGEATVTLI